MPFDVIEIVFKSMIGLIITLALVGLKPIFYDELYGTFSGVLCVCVFSCFSIIVNFYCARIVSEYVTI